MIFSYTLIPFFPYYFFIHGKTCINFPFYTIPLCNNGIFLFDVNTCIFDHIYNVLFRRNDIPILSAISFDVFFPYIINLITRVKLLINLMHSQSMNILQFKFFFVCFSLLVIKVSSIVTNKTYFYNKTRPLVFAN